MGAPVPRMTPVTNSKPDLWADLARQRYNDATGIYVRAKKRDALGDKWTSVDIGELDLPSLRLFLRQEGGENLWAEVIIAMMLQHSRDAVEKAWGPARGKTLPLSYEPLESRFAGLDFGEEDEK